MDMDQGVRADANITLGSRFFEEGYGNEWSIVSPFLQGAAMLGIKLACEHHMIQPHISLFVRPTRNKSSICFSIHMDRKARNAAHNNAS